MFSNLTIPAVRCEPKDLEAANSLRELHLLEGWREAFPLLHELGVLGRLGTALEQEV